MRRPPAGFTLIELLIAMTLAVIIFAGLFNVSSSMTRKHLEAIHRGEVNGATLAALDAVPRDVSGASYLFTPTDAAQTGDAIGGCTNWSSQGGGLNVGAASDASQPIAYFLYCVDGAGARFSSLYRYGGTIPDCQGGVTLPGGCGAADSRGNGAFAVISGNGVNFGVSRADNFGGYYFARSRDTGGVEVHYIVGNSTPTADAAGAPARLIPQYYKIDTRIRLNRSFNNLQD